MNNVFKLHLKEYLQLFADDAVLMYSCTSVQELAEQIKHDLDLVYGWFYNNHLSFHLGKIKMMIIQERGLNVEDSPAITVRGTEIERVYSYKYF